MKRLLSTVITIFLITTLCACGNSNADAPNDSEESSKIRRDIASDEYVNNDIVSNNSNQTPAEQDTAHSQEKSLWNKTIDYEILSIPEEAYAGGCSRCTGIAPDGIHFLMGNNSKPYLWNCDTGAILFLCPGDAETEDCLKEYGDLITLGTHETSEEYDSFNNNLRSLHGTKLMDALSVATESGISFFPDYVQHYDNWMAIYEPRSGLNFALDTETGKFYAFYDEDDYGFAFHISSVRDGKILSTYTPTPCVYVMDIASHNFVVLDFNTATSFDGCAIYAASFLPDGRICAIARNSLLNSEEGHDVELILWDEDNVKTYSLGKTFHIPDQILCTENGAVVATSRAYIRDTMPYVIDLDSHHISKISTENNAPILTPVHPDECNETSEGSASCWPIQLAADGKTILLDMLNNNIVLFDPLTGNWQHLLYGGEETRISGVISSGNGYDIFKDYTKPAEYIKLIIREDVSAEQR